MIYIPWILGYLAIGAMGGLVSAERYHQNSSEASREMGDYVFSACAYAIVWPMFLLIAAKDGERA